MMASEKFRVVGIDFSTVALSKARQSGIEMVAVDVDEGLPFKANTFDYVWATDVLEHVFDPIHVVMEASRVLRNGGYLLLAVPNDLTLKRRLAVFFTGRSPQSKIYRARGQYKHHTLFSLDLLKYMLVDKGGFRLQFFYATLPGTKRALHSEMIAALFGSTFVAICSKG
jgi:SAM-dependent methyltransferase